MNENYSEENLEVAAKSIVVCARTLINDKKWRAKVVEPLVMDMIKNGIFEIEDIKGTADVVDEYKLLKRLKHVRFFNAAMEEYYETDDFYEAFKDDVLKTFLEAEEE